MKNSPLRHSGEGRNPACHKVPRSGQGRIVGVVPLLEPLAIRLGCQKTPAKSLVMRGILSIVWIPAFAGMTVVANVCVMIYGKLNNCAGIENWKNNQWIKTIKPRLPQCR